MMNSSEIAILSQGIVCPGAEDTDQFWTNVNARQGFAKEVRTDYWASTIEIEEVVCDRLVPDKAIGRCACLIKDFTPNMSGSRIPADALRSLDPLYQYTLHAGREALDAIDCVHVDPKRVGVILAAIALPTDASSWLTRHLFNSAILSNTLPDIRHEGSASFSHKEILASRVTSLPAALMAAAFGFRGTTYTLDAACASSLYALKLSCDELTSGRVDMMVTGGVSRPDCLYTQVGFSQLRALSPSGRCAPFDADADGLVVGEGAGILVLKRLEDAVAAKDPILGVIRGIGLSNDMRGNLLAPDAEGQLRAMRAAYAQAGWEPHEVDLIECHGTGTPAGDAVEAASLRKLWGAYGWRPEQCAIGSVKSMIGHLLTGAGAVGMIKLLSALSHEALPPSLNFNRFGPDSPLIDGPFRVQTEPAPWKPRDPDTLRKAAVSAFGFGGINAHVLVEEYRPATAKPASSPIANRETPSAAIAIVGMAATFGELCDLRQFQHAVFSGRTAIKERPDDRWKQADGAVNAHLNGMGRFGVYLSEVKMTTGQFQVPPNEIPDILPQQLLMLKVGADALVDAGLPLHAPRPRMGATIGVSFDMEATNFHLRWQLPRKVRDWNRNYRLGLSEGKCDQWAEALADEIGPPLTATRTLGALGGIVASRVAREFKFGGPSFIISQEEASGLRALEIALRALQQNEVDAMLVGAVDLCGDPRTVISLSHLSQLSTGSCIRAFDRNANGTLPGEGAAAVVLKRLEDAVADGDRVYAIIRGLGSAMGEALRGPTPIVDTYTASVRQCLGEANLQPEQMDLFEAHGCGVPAEDAAESEALQTLLPLSQETAHALGTVKPIIGHTGASAGLASVVKAVLCLHHSILAPLPDFSAPANRQLEDHGLHIPVFPSHWFKNKSEGPRRTCVGAITRDGGCMHLLLEEATQKKGVGSMMPPIADRLRPLGDKPSGLFLLPALDAATRARAAGELTAQLTSDRPLEAFAREWYRRHPLQITEPKIAVVTKSLDHLRHLLEAVKDIKTDLTERLIEGPGGIAMTQKPLGEKGEVAFVFPGSGNHYLGMGRGIGLQWPQILQEMDAATDQLRTQMLPEYYLPWRVDWRPGWEDDARERIEADVLRMIFGQVVHGDLMTRVMDHFGVHANAAIGYSLGESAAHFAMGVWPERGEMLARMQGLDLFTTQLAGPCLAARRQWGIGYDEAFDWTVAVVPHPKTSVEAAIEYIPQVRLLIINTPDECVIGGHRPQVETAIMALGGEAHFLKGVVTVHCDAALPAAEAYRDLHRFPVTAPEGYRYYSCAEEKALDLSTDSLADAITKQATQGFDFTQPVAKAHADGVRLFVEMGPGGSCTRMIRQILGNKPHLALSTCQRGEDDYFTLLKLLGNMVVHGVAVNLDQLYGPEAYPPAVRLAPSDPAAPVIRVPVGGHPIQPKTPPPAPITIEPICETACAETGRTGEPTPSTLTEESQAPFGQTVPDLWQATIDRVVDIGNATTQIHEQFLQLSQELTATYARGVALQQQLSDTDLQVSPLDTSATTEAPPPASPLFDRDLCMEFAIGSVGKMLGPDFAVIDTYPVRVRLPDEPLMLVDRILSVEGERQSLGSGRVITEHDVLPGAWYLDAGVAPACIAVEAGQADLFLCSYLGIDHVVQGKRAYRLLDATVRFHRGLPRPGETIRYDIHIDRFVRQGETYLFFFRFKGFIGDQHLITMTDGCAGFFTAEEVEHSGGILGEASSKNQKGRLTGGYRQLVAATPESYNDAQVEALRHGDLAAAFGDAFRNKTLAPGLRLPGGRMRLLERVLSLDPTGGPYGLGVIRAEADIHPDDWFLTCHFVDDMVMPGTLMYECCVHTLRIFLQRMGWISNKEEACYEPVIGQPAVLKCRGPVTPKTRHVHYEVIVREMGYNPAPYVIAEALMVADGRLIVRFDGMSMQLTGVTKELLESLWFPQESLLSASTQPAQADVSAAPLFTREKLRIFATGKPSEAFGEPYRIFDSGRFIARLPAPPYAFIDRVMTSEPRPWVLEPGGWVTAEFDVLPDAWYFAADRSGSMAFSLLLEVALQPCGWLAAYAGSALRSAADLKFRNLGGEGRLHCAVFPDAGTLTMRARLTKVSEAGSMIIEHFDFEIIETQGPVYTGTTYFGFFNAEALAAQVGLKDVGVARFSPRNRENARRWNLPDEPPLTPEGAGANLPAIAPELCLPGRALRMIDRVDAYEPTGGPHGLGLIRGSKTVDPEEWFFKAHFYQDPVCPGSLGVESFIQLMKLVAMDRWPALKASHRFEVITDPVHRWTYRGQVLPTNRKVTVTAVVTRVEEGASPALFADGLLAVDGLSIYHMGSFGLRLVPRSVCQ